jgi:hypothetical protein
MKNKLKAKINQEGGSCGSMLAQVHPPKEILLLHF